MPSDRQRNQNGTPAAVALQVSSAAQLFITELAFTENVSLHGVRVVTGRAWKPGERVIVKSYNGSVQSRATVISDLLTYRLGKMLRNHANHEAGDAISFCIVAVSSGHSRCT